MAGKAKKTPTAKKSKPKPIRLTAEGVVRAGPRGVVIVNPESAVADWDLWKLVNAGLSGKPVKVVVTEVMPEC